MLMNKITDYIQTLADRLEKLEKDNNRLQYQVGYLATFHDPQPNPTAGNTLEKYFNTR